jgi:hypothetical protein
MADESFMPCATKRMWQNCNPFKQLCFLKCNTYCLHFGINLEALFDCLNMSIRSNVYVFEEQSEDVEL